MSFVELSIVAIIALLLLGPDQLPGVARTIGKTLRDLRKASDDLKSTFDQELVKLEAEIDTKPKPKAKPVSAAQAPAAGAAFETALGKAPLAAGLGALTLDQARQATVPAPSSTVASNLLATPSAPTPSAPPSIAPPAQIDPGALRAQARAAAAPADPGAARAAARKAALAVAAAPAIAAPSGSWSGSAGEAPAIAPAHGAAGASNAAAESDDDSFDIDADFGEPLANSSAHVPSSPPAFLFAPVLAAAEPLPPDDEFQPLRRAQLAGAGAPQLVAPVAAPPATVPRRKPDGS